MTAMACGTKGPASGSSPTEKTEEVSSTPEVMAETAHPPSEIVEFRPFGFDISLGNESESKDDDVLLADEAREGLVCVPQCDGRQCGSDGCNGSCGQCPENAPCNQESGQCEAANQCGDGVCHADEEFATCSLDCPCIPNCDALECGPDPICAEDCGQCPAGQHCQNGACAGGSCWPLCESEILIHAGPFWMGCDQLENEQCANSEVPYRWVHLDAYYIDHTEVTVQQYAQCVTQGACSKPSIEYDGCNWDREGAENHPQNCVTWEQASAFCAWAGKRLPTEAEWEKAARGNDGRSYPWGQLPPSCSLANMDQGGKGCGTGYTAPVCSRSPDGDSPYGLCDAAGNVWELTADWYMAPYYQSAPDSNPQGPTGGAHKSVRGGSFVSGDAPLTTHDRYFLVPDFHQRYLGFRCARTVSP